MAGRPVSEGQPAVRTAVIMVWILKWRNSGLPRRGHRSDEQAKQGATRGLSPYGRADALHKKLGDLNRIGTDAPARLMKATTVRWACKRLRSWTGASVLLCLRGSQLSPQG